MNRNIKKLAFGLLLTAMVMPLASCSDSDDGPKMFNLAVSLNLPQEVSSDNVENLKLVVSKSGAADTINLETKLDTVLTLPQGQYDIKATGKVTDDPQGYVTGTLKTDLYANTSARVSLSKYNKSPLVFCTIYTTGGAAGYMTDGYIEIANNSDEEQYLGNLILFYAKESMSPNAWQAAGITDRYPMAQGSCIAFPDDPSNKDLYLAPGQKVLVAQDAADHTKLDTKEGAVHSDLTNAPFEIYLDYSKMNDIDYPATNMKVLYYNNAYMKAWGLGFFSGAYVLAKLPKGLTPEAWVADESSFSLTPNSTSTDVTLMMPSKYVLDAVEMWDETDKTHNSTFLPKDDAQGIFGSETWKGLTLRRKVNKIEGNKVFYQDTNNSANDFLNNQPQTPFVQPTTVDVK